MTEAENGVMCLLPLNMEEGCQVELVEAGEDKEKEHSPVDT